MPAIRDWIKDIKRFWSGDKESKITDLARGSSALIGGGKDASSLSMQSLSMQNGAYEELHKTLFLDPDIMNRYTDYEEMDDYPELSAALDVYADDCTIPDNVHNKTIWAICDDAVVRNVIDDLLSRRLRIEDDIYGLVRTLCKYGNAFAEVVANETGVLGLNYLSPPTVRRIEDGNGTLLCYVQSMSRDISLTFDELKKELAKPKDARKGVNGCTIFDPWEIVHWRLRTKNMRSAYGCSVLDSARWIWRRLMMMEDTALVYKLTRSPARYAFYVDTGDLPPDEAIAYVRQVQRQYKNKKLVNPTTGQLDFRYNPLSPHEDFWIPTRGGKDSTRIEVISGPDYQSMEDVEYFRSKMVAIIKVPRRYLGLEEGANRSLSQEDVRFARTCMRIQREFKNGIRRVIRIHLAAMNIDPDVTEYSTEMSIPSYIFELAQIEVRNAQAGLAQMLEMYFPKEWIIRHIFGFSDGDAAVVKKEKSQEMRRDAIDNASVQSEIIRDYPEVTGMPPVTPEQDMQGQETAGKGVKPGSNFGESIDRRVERLVKQSLDSSIASRDAVKEIREGIIPLVRDMHRRKMTG